MVEPTHALATTVTPATKRAPAVSDKAQQNEIIKAHLPAYKGKCDLKGAPAELKDALKCRWQNCEAVNQCVAFDFGCPCDCFPSLLCKLTHEPEASRYQQRKHGENWRKAFSYACALQDVSEEERNALIGTIQTLQFAFGRDVMAEVRVQYQSLKQARTCDTQKA